MAQQAIPKTNDVASTWYASVSNSTRVTQGDIIKSCPVLIWKEDYFKEHENLMEKSTEDMLGEGVGVSIEDVIVMTQACDLEHSKVDDIILCPLASIQNYSKDWKDDQQSKSQNPKQENWKKWCDQIVDGFHWNLFMLNRSDLKPEMSQQVVDFHVIYTVPIVYLVEILRRQGGNRLRLLPPYREHLSQAFARYFMRVGLPEQVDKDWPKLADIRK